MTTHATADSASAGVPEARTSILRTLIVDEGETVAETTCFGCGIVVRGRVLGDTVAILGGVDVEGSSGRGQADDVVAVGGAVHVGARATVPASIVSLGGPVRIAPGATASYDVDSLPWLHVPGQRQVLLEGAVSLVAFVLVVVAAGAALVRARGIAARDAALVRAPLARGLLGASLVLALVCVVANGRRLGGFADPVQAALGLAVLVATSVGSAGVASLLGRGLARLVGRRLVPGWRSAALGAPALALLCLVPLLGALLAIAALCFCAGGVMARRATLTAPSPDEVSR